MKKILFAAFAATLLAASCQKTEVIGLDSDQANGPAMSFSTEMKKITKTDDTTDPTKTGTAKLESQGFKLWVYADFTADDFANSTNVWLNATENNKYLIYDSMWNLAMTYDSGWKAPDNMEYYWPGTGKDLRFFAVSGLNSSATIAINHGITYAPAQTANEGAGDEDETENETETENVATPNMIITGFDVTATTDEKPTVDLMVADFRKQNQGQNSRVVKLNFRHALTKIDFKFKTSPDDNGDLSDVFVQKLEVSNLNTTGNLTVTQGAKVNPTAGGDDAEVYEVNLYWSGFSGSDVFTANCDTDVVADGFPSEFTNIDGELIRSTATGEDLTEYENASKSLKLTEEAQVLDSWLMLPCEDITGKIITITYVIKDRQFQTKFSLGGNKTTGTDGRPAYQLTSWDVNQYVAYTIDLSPNKISFSASASDWTKFDGDGDDDDIVMNN